MYVLSGKYADGQVGNIRIGCDNGLCHLTQQENLLHLPSMMEPLQKKKSIRLQWFRVQGLIATFVRRASSAMNGTNISSMPRVWTAAVIPICQQNHCETGIGFCPQKIIKKNPKPQIRETKTKKIRSKWIDFQVCFYFPLQLASQLSCCCPCNNIELELQKP